MTGIFDMGTRGSLFVESCVCMLRGIPTVYSICIMMFFFCTQILMIVGEKLTTYTFLAFVSTLPIDFANP